MYFARTRALRNQPIIAFNQSINQPNPTQPTARAAVGPLVVTHLALGGLQLLVCALGLFILADPTDMVMCHSVAHQGRIDLIVALIAISQLADVSMKCCCHMMLAGDEFGDEIAEDLEMGVGPGGGRGGRWREHESSLQTYSHAEERWRGRCNFLCTCLRYTTCHLFSATNRGGGGGGASATTTAAAAAAAAGRGITGGGGEGGGDGGGMGMVDLEVVARVMADIFHSEGFLDVLPSDVMAAFILLRHAQKAQEHELVARGQDPGVIGRLEEGIGPEAAARAAAEAAHDAGAVAGQRLQRRGSSHAEAAEAAAVAEAAARVRFQSGHYLVQNALDKEDPEDRKVGLKKKEVVVVVASAYALFLLLIATVPPPSKQTAGAGGGHLLRGVRAGHLHLDDVHGRPHALRGPPGPSRPPRLPDAPRPPLERARRCVGDGDKEGGSAIIIATAICPFFLTPTNHKKNTPPHTELGAVVGDNFFRAHEAGLLEFTRNKGTDCDLAYATFINSIYERPYALFVDHKWQTVVLAIRGTLSLEDLINDAHAEPVRPTDRLNRPTPSPLLTDRPID